MFPKHLTCFRNISHVSETSHMFQKHVVLAHWAFHNSPFTLHKRLIDATVGGVTSSEPLHVHL